ncbi:AAA domain-containing protein [Collimonas sp. OK607]|uniref:AAA family ATPase n=1 Tax=Collimonas sp. OK607 TaxID=1798194 RepID=UPI0008EEFA98|nr:AAA family ATPase [Collimonas sp. OK607]SFB41813.1 AAA domain-containing protein [Collimonas sp. OK607]
MKIQLNYLNVRTKKTVESITFSPGVTFLHGPIGKGKSSVARMIDYCFGGELERTPAIQLEFIAAELSLRLGDCECLFERAADDTQAVKVTWTKPSGEQFYLNAPLAATEKPIFAEVVCSLSDLIFFLCGVTPIKVRKRNRDPDSPLIRLSFRDIWWYCYLEQAHLDSSFYRLEDPFRGRKSQDAMRFFTGLHSDRLNQLDGELFQAQDQQRVKRETVKQIRVFMEQFGWSSEIDLAGEINGAKEHLAQATNTRKQLDATRLATTHPTDPLRIELRQRGAKVELLQVAIQDAEQSMSEQYSLRAELITAKTKASRAEQAGQILEGVAFLRCPECGADIAGRTHSHDHCRLCLTPSQQSHEYPGVELEALHRDMNDRIEQIGDSIQRREREIARMHRLLAGEISEKEALDAQLQTELARYDSSFVESVRASEREIATYAERIRSLERLEKMPLAINTLEEDAGSLQGKIDLLKTASNAEREKLRIADGNVAELEAEFKRILIDVSFPGISEIDDVIINPRNWEPIVRHKEQEWGFWDTGSGGKKTLFNVCYALAVHSVALRKNLPIPNILIIDSPTKNISEDKDPQLVRALYDEIYKLALGVDGKHVQFLLIDSDLVVPATELGDFIERRMAGEPSAPALISYYFGP